ncbi:acyl CoA:acetate/3-ketoacid CoA transferase [Pukyongiella litopenaei]|uniref:Acyl CoA:acetate/3-ketoacid CoA transferase n=1 Tax=Pukyongiella litopenaei TaxID=2605946 RepID=A0A2S0MLV3_9RHOB|nr:acyl CoA:acetate/3-ketoacid CoA transferase [Pukyongiella litopenaei]AVO36663.1 acyl CoA:acetate/3-ketoacid CoA transferase [Pukyongiella litopenaei]
MRNKIISTRDAVRLIAPGNVITTSGFVGIGVPDALLAALEARFLETGDPGDLTLLFAAGQGDGADRGLNRLGHEGLLKRVVGGHWGLIPKVAQLATSGLIEAYNLPQGVISHLFRDIAAGRPGTLSHVGLGTFVDPRQDGGRINDVTTEALVELVEIAGRELLFYHGFPIDVALLRGTTADPSGNVTMEREALLIDNLAQAMAVRNSGGVVIVQVERIAAKGSLNPRDVGLPGPLVDAVVVADPDHHMQTYATRYSHLFAGRFRAPEGPADPLPLDARKIIARRAAFELPVNGVVNLGIGMPEGVAAVAAEEGLLDHVTLTAEPGVIGGQPASGLDFGAAINTDAIIPQNAQFDFYDGGGLDLAVLGMAETDMTGNVNVSRFGTRLAGAGGFINISQNARKVVFAGTFSAGGLKLGLDNGTLRIASEGRARKFCKRVSQITFAGARAADEGRTVLYVTERCVFELTPDGLRLAEVAPGVDIDRDILGQMDFAPIVDAPEPMDGRLFRDEPMGLAGDLLHLDLDHRFALDENGDRLFINFEKLRIRSRDDLDRIAARVERICQPLQRRVDVIVNYDGARVEDDIADDYAAMVRSLEDRFYGVVSRYSSSAFMRMKLGQALERQTAPHIFETGEEARQYLERRSRRD